MKSRAVIKLVSLGQIGCKPGKARPTQKQFKAGDLLLAAPHAGFEQAANKGGHAHPRFGGFDAQPIGDFLAQSDGDVFHDTNIV
ncbi:hypothetical protein CR492_07480 [Methylocella silvestris]|uniref:Uncharacterized protein n=1 Tax=Methylocella silvestris TaxID=199596 RepID=A0A2J7TID6_METSI|nr:hypothetical protein CR492_07480 [Methylocella silvestris]